LVCNNKMIRWGKTNKGTFRWYCVNCKKSGVKRRKDVVNNNYRKLFNKYVLGNRTIKEIAKDKDRSSKYIIEKFNPFWKQIPHSKFPVLNNKQIIVCDATWIQKTVLLVVYEKYTDKVLGFSFNNRESYYSWFLILSELKVRINPQYCVLDGHQGLNKAIKECFSSVCMQRCLVHIKRFIRIKLSNSPKTEAGRELKEIVRLLPKIENKDQSEIFLKNIDNWKEKHKDFLNEKSINKETKRKRHTHKNLRGAIKHIENARSNLFVFLLDDSVPKTTNIIEGGINSPLKDLLRKHRGLSIEKQKILCIHYLIKRREIPTRKVN